jgi:hypothetical protein
VFSHFTLPGVGRRLHASVGIVEATMITRKEVEAHRENGGRLTRVERSAILWLVFYAVAATAALVSKIGEAATLFAGLSPF